MRNCLLFATGGDAKVVRCEVTDVVYTFLFLGAAETRTEAASSEYKRGRRRVSCSAGCKEDQSSVHKTLFLTVKENQEV